MECDLFEVSGQTALPAVTLTSDRLPEPSRFALAVDVPSGMTAVHFFDVLLST